MPKSRRPHAASPREHKVGAKYNDAEFTAVKRAADRDGLAVGAWLARAGIDAATDTAIPASRVQLDMLRALQDATEQVRRVGRLFNQAVARLHSTGTIGPEFRRYADNIARAVRALEATSITAARKIL